jgi:membrane protease YdiL (CAAX protease family)
LKNTWLVSFIRIPKLIIILLIFFLLLKIFGLEFQFPFLPDLSPIYFTVVNVLCFFLLHYILKREGRTIKELIGFRSERLGKDILLGFLWLFVLYVPFMLAILGTMFILYGTDLFQHFQTVFVGNGEIFTLTRPSWLMWLTACISVVFPFLNAPIEELMYRGYAQPLFIKHYSALYRLYPSFQESNRKNNCSIIRLRLALLLSKMVVPYGKALTEKSKQVNLQREESTNINW